ncbi:MAG: hypothetical protein HRT71_04525 [Flavobacteriales bacterium]|nr:hypothetical protein [Flavobacteriales bacterium]
MKSKKRSSLLLGKYKVICVANQVLGYGEYGNFLIDPLKRDEKLVELRKRNGIEEIMYLTTSNREMFVLITEDDLDTEYLSKFFNSFKDSFSTAELNTIKNDSFCLSGRAAISHLFCVAGTMDSRGYIERGIVKTLIAAQEFSLHNELSGNAMALIIERAAECANMVFTKTDILKNRMVFDPQDDTKRYSIAEHTLHKNKWVKAVIIVESYVVDFEISLKGIRRIKNLEEYAAA